MTTEAVASGRRAPRARERGVAMIWAVFAAMVIAGIVFTGTDAFRAMDRLGGAEFAADGHARNVAEAGLVDAFAWFRRQQTQPVTSFAPKRDLAAVPPVNETDDPAIGLMREYEIMPAIWARYEVRKSLVAEPFVDGDANGRYSYGESYTDTNGNGRRDPARETTDVSLQRGQSAAGAVWRIESHGAVYRRQNAGVPLGTDPNVRLSSATVAAEVRRLAITPPAIGAVCCRNGSSINIGSRGRILGGSKSGLVYLTSTGTPVVSGTAEVKGTPAQGTVPSYVDTIQAVFGVSLLELKGMADASYATAAAFPSKIGDYTLNVMNGAITFDATRPLSGTGVVVVTGNCTISPSSNSFFNGVLYVQGDLQIRGPVYLRGTVIATGTVDIAGSGGDYSEVNYDGAIVSQVLVLLGQYRYSTGIYEPSPRLPDGTPDEDNLIRLQKNGLALPGGNLPTALGESIGGSG